MALTGSTNAEKIWNFCKSKGMTDYGCAGVLGNMDCESGLIPNNMEDTYQQRLCYTDAEYTAAVNSESYTNFARDAVGFGLCQWSSFDRKQALLNYARSCGYSIDDLEMQLNFFLKELMEKFPAVLDILKTATSVLQASNSMLLQYERPLNSGASVQALRASYSQKYYDRFAGKTVEVRYNMGYATVKKGSNTKMSEHFSSNEFDCHGSGCCTETIINEKLVEYLEKIREHFGKPIQITSGYRCVRHNSNIGGATGSRHSKGDAADIVITGVTPREVAKYAESVGIKGIGLYETSADGHFVHIDTREAKSFWYGQACSPRTTFYNSTITQPATNASNQNFIKRGDRGSNVVDLQNKLIKLGYSCGAYGADGIFGLGTYNAVKKFQSDKGFSIKDQDGIVGEKTADAIDTEIKKIASNACVEYIVTASALNVRSAPGTSNSIVGIVKRGDIINIAEERNGWGKINTGWVSMQYTQRKG